MDVSAILGFTDEPVKGLVGADAESKGNVEPVDAFDGEGDLLSGSTSPPKDGRGSGTHQRTGRSRKGTAGASWVEEQRAKPGGYEIAEMKSWHQQVADWFLLNPGGKIREAAQHFSVTPEWMGRVIRSDLYQAYFDKRLTDHQGLVSKQVIAKAGDVALQGLKVIGAKIQSQGTGMEISDLVKATELSTKALGLGLKPSGGSQGPVQMIFNGVNPELLERARTSLRLVGEQNTQELKAEKEAESILLPTEEDRVLPISTQSVSETEKEAQDVGFIKDIVEDAELIAGGGLPSTGRV